MVLLQDLPSEILLDIVEHLVREWRSDFGVCDMLSLSLISQRWSRTVFERFVSQCEYPTRYMDSRRRGYINEEINRLCDQPMTKAEYSKDFHRRIHCRDLSIHNWHDYVRLSMDAGLPQMKSHVDWSAADLYLRKNVQAQRFKLPTRKFPLFDASGALTHRYEQNCAGMESKSVIYGREVASTRVKDLVCLERTIWYDNWRKVMIAQNNHSALEFAARRRASMNGSN